MDYNLSLLSVKYLYEKLGLEEFKRLMHNNERITEYGNNIVNEAINYYKDKMMES